MLKVTACVECCVQAPSVPNTGQSASALTETFQWTKFQVRIISTSYVVRFTDWLTDYTVRIYSKEAKRSQLGIKFSAFYWTWRFITALTTACPYPDQVNQPHAPSPLLEIHFNIMLPSVPRSSKWCPSLRSPHHNHSCTSFFPIHATRPTHLILIDFITRIIFGEEYRP